MDAFQGSYRTEPWDLRCFSAYYLLLRFLLLFVAEYIVSRFSVPVSAFVMLLSVFIFTLFQPYKNLSHNRVDIALMLLLSLFYVGFTADIIGSSIDYQWLSTAQIIFAVPVALFLFYVVTEFIFVPLYCKLLHFKSQNNTDRDEEFDRNAMESCNRYPSLLSSGQTVKRYT